MKWINVETQLPELYKRVLVTDGEVVGISYMVKPIGHDKQNWSYCDLKPNEIFFWMPLPCPPCPLYNAPNNCNCHMRVDIIG